MISSNTSIISLRKKYSKNKELDSMLSFQDAFKRHVVSKKQSLIDLTIVAANLTPQVLMNIDDLDPLLVKSIRETNPNFDPSLISSFSENEMMGILNSAKGKYFEYIVTDKLNSGEIVGDVQLPDGFEAVMASSLNQPGWDLKILDQNGNISDYLQLKATNSLAYINETLERYPDITILSTSEVANGAEGLVLDSGISESELLNNVSATVSDLTPSNMDDFLEAFNPLMPLVFILATEGYHLSVGDSSVENMINSSRLRSERALLASGVGALIYAIGGGILALPATFVGGAMYDYYQNMSLASFSYEKSTQRLKKYRLYQQQKLIEEGMHGVSF